MLNWLRLLRPELRQSGGEPADGRPASSELVSARGAGRAETVLLVAWDELTTGWACALVGTLIRHGRRPVLLLAGADPAGTAMTALLREHPAIGYEVITSLATDQASLSRSNRWRVLTGRHPDLSLRRLLKSVATDLRELLAAVAGSLFVINGTGVHDGLGSRPATVRSAFALHALLNGTGGGAAALQSFPLVALRATVFFTLRRAVQRKLRHLRPDVVMLARDAFGSREHAIRLALELEGCAFCVMPVAYTPKSQLVMTYGAMAQHRLDPGQARAVERLLPGSTATTATAAVARLPVRVIAMMALVERGATDPWLLGGNATLLAGNHHLHALYRADRCDGSASVILTGHPKSDELSRYVTMTATERERKRAMLGCNARAKLVTVSIAPDIFGGTLYRAQPGLPDFEAYLAAVAATIGQLGKRAEVVISPHPRLRGNAAAMRALATLGRVSAAPIQRLLGVSDGFVSYVGSSVNIDASMLAIPALAFVIYEGALDQLQTVGAVNGMLPVFTASEARQAAALLLEPQTFARWSCQPVQDAASYDPQSEWQLLDGKSGERIVAALDTVTSGQVRHYRAAIGCTS